MACIGCGTNTPLLQTQINALYGAPLSNACSRANISGSIPAVVRFPFGTQVSGGYVATQPSIGGFAKATPASVFWKTGSSNCYGNGNDFGIGSC